MEELKEQGRADLRGRLKDVIHHHIALGVEAIFSGVFMGNNPEKVSLHHLLNRVMMVAQAPITFLIFIQDGEIFREVYKTNRHKNEEHQRKIRDRSNECLDSPKDYLFPLWIDEAYKDRYNDPEDKVYKRYYLAVLKADTDQFEPLKRIDKDNFFLVTNIWEAISYKLEHIFLPDKYKSYDEKFHSYLVGSIYNLINSSSDIDKKKLTVDKKLRENFFKKLERNTTDYTFVGKGVLDRVFEKLQKAIHAISMCKDNATNFLFYVRDYDDRFLQGSKRYDEYDYNIRILIGSTQEQQLVDHIKKWGSVEIQESLKEKLKIQINGFNDETQQFALSIHDGLIEKIHSAGYVEIIRNLANNFGKDTRSIADPVFDGVSFYRAPFDKDIGIGRSFPRNQKPVGRFKDQSIFVQNDLLRLITFFYLLESMATSSKLPKMQLRVMLNPIELGGRVWGVAGYATRSFDWSTKFYESSEGIKASEVIEEYNKFWLQNYHICNDVNERMKKNLRTYMNRLYERTIAEEYVNWVNGLANDSINKKKINLSDEIDRFNYLTEQLTCLFPYDMVKISVNFVKGDSSPQPSYDGVNSICHAFLAPYYAATPVVVGKSYFPDAPGDASTRNFVDRMDLSIAMTDAILRTALAIDDKANN